MWSVQFFDPETNELFCEYNFSKCSSAYAIKDEAQKVGHVFAPEPAYVKIRDDESPEGYRFALARIGMNVDRFGECIRIHYEED